MIKKSASLGNLKSHLHMNHEAHLQDHASASPADGYLSDDPAHHGPGYSSCRVSDRKKGVPWMEEEHHMFLVGLQKLGKGDWRGISRHYVTTRTPTQVASHAQKYFIRQSNTGRRKRRSSLFDMPQDMANDPHCIHEDLALAPRYEIETEILNSTPSLDLSLRTDSSSALLGAASRDHDQGYSPRSIPVSMPLWLSQVASPLQNMNKLLLMDSENVCRDDSSSLSLKLLCEPPRQSAFHAKPSLSVPDLSKGKHNPIQAV